MTSRSLHSPGQKQGTPQQVKPHSLSTFGFCLWYQQFFEAVSVK